MNVAGCIMAALDTQRRRDLFRIGIEADTRPDDYVPTVWLARWQADRLADAGYAPSDYAVRFRLFSDSYDELSPDDALPR